MPSEVYAARFTVESCYDGGELCNDCYVNGVGGYAAPWYYCAQNGGLSSEWITITLIR